MAETIAKLRAEIAILRGLLETQYRETDSRSSQKTGSTARKAAS